ncbi:G1/S-specific cyclin-D3-like [Haemaphysalis longicornis]
MEECVELLCMESANLGQVLRAPRDPAIVGDSGVVAGLLHLQSRYAADRHYCKHVQPEILEPMRKTLALWMSEVCEERGCRDSVFPTAMNLLDRYLSRAAARKCQLQLLGCVCLLLASKVRQTRPLALHDLAYLTENSVSARQIQEWELRVLQRLDWDVASVVASDFVDHLVAMLRLPECADTVRRHAHTFVSLCATEYHFIGYTPALLATASVAAAVHGLRGPLHTTRSQDTLLSSLERITNVPTVDIRRCVLEIETLIAANVADLQQQAPSKATTNLAAVPVTYGSSKNNGLVTPSGADISSQPNTPTDVQDIKF